jgi:hypothetical protein
LRSPERYPPWWVPFARFRWTRRRQLAMLHARVTELYAQTGRPFEPELARVVSKLMRSRRYRADYAQALAARRRQP